MSNWCFQTLVISGEKNDLTPFVNKLLASWHNYQDNPAKGQYELLETFYPMPDDVYRGSFLFNDLDASALSGQKADDLNSYIAAWTKEQLEIAKEKYGENGWLWYFWGEEHWGSNWADLGTIMHEHDDTHIKISYVSAWGPILPGILLISNDYPLLTFFVDYQNELLNNPDGRAKMKGGEILSEWQESEEECKEKVSAFYGDS